MIFGRIDCRRVRRRPVFVGLDLWKNRPIVAAATRSLLRRAAFGRLILDRIVFLPRWRSARGFGPDRRAYCRFRLGLARWPANRPDRRACENHRRRGRVFWLVVRRLAGRRRSDRRRYRLSSRIALAICRAIGPPRVFCFDPGRLDRIALAAVDFPPVHLDRLGVFPIPGQCQAFAVDGSSDSGCPVFAHRRIASRLVCRRLVVFLQTAALHQPIVFRRVAYRSAIGFHWIVFHWFVYCRIICFRPPV